MPSPIRALTLATALASSFFLPASSFAQTFLGGGGNDNLTNKGNWEGGVAPTSGTNADLLVLGGTGMANDTGATFSLRSLEVYSTPAAFTISGTPFLFTGDNPYIANTTNFFARFTADVIVGTRLTLAGSSYLVFEGAFNDPDNLGVNVTNPQALTELAGTFQLGNVSVQNLASLTLSGNGTISGTLESFGSSIITFSGTAANSRTLTNGSVLRANGGRIQFYGGTTRFDGTTTVGPGSFDIINGTLDGSGDIDFNQAPTDVFTFFQGAILGNAGQKASVNGGYFQFNGPNGIQQLGRELILRSPDVRLTTGTLQLVQNGSLTIDGTVAQIRGSDFAITGTGPANKLRLINAGVLQKTSGSGSGTFVLDAPLDLGTGTLQVDAGSVRLNAGSVMPSGSVLFPAFITEIEFSGGTHELDAVAMVGQGNIALSGGTLVTNPASTIDLGSVVGSLELRGGTLTGGASNLVSPAVSWNATTLTTTFAAPAVATTVVPTFLALTGTAGRLLERRSILATGGGNWVGGDLTIAGGDAANPAAFTLAGSGGAIFRVQSDQSVLPGAGGNAFFLVNGGNRLVKEFSSGTTTIAVPFGSSGSVEVNSGRLLLTGGSGTFNVAGGLSVANGTTLEFGGGAYSLNFPTWNGSGGAFVVSGSGTTLSLGNGANLGGFGSRLDLLDGLVTGITFALNGSSVNWDATRLGNTLAAPTVASASVNGPLNIVGSSTHVLDRRTLFLGAGGSWTGGDLEIGGGGAGNLAGFTLAGGNFRIQSDQAVLQGPAGFGNFIVNGGTRLIKETTGGTTNIQTTFSSNGSVEVNSGRLLLTGGSGTFNIAGGLSVANGTTLEFGGGAFNINFPTWNGSGGAFVVSGSGTTLSMGNGANLGGFGSRLDLFDGLVTGITFALNGTSVNWGATRLGNTLAAPAVASASVNGPLNLVGSATHVLDRRTLFLGAGGSWTGGDLEIGGGGAGNLAGFTLAGGNFRIQSDQAVLQGPAGFGNFIVNGGTRLIKETTGGTTNIQTTFSSNGSVEVNSGRLLLTGGSGTFNIAGGLSVANDTTLEFGGGAFNINFPTWNGSGGAFVVSGSGTTISMGNGANLGGFGSRLDLLDGLVTGIAFSLNGTSVNWGAARLGNTLAAPAVASANVNGPLNLVGSAKHVLDRRTLFLGSGGTWTGGDLEIGGGGAGNLAAFTISLGTFRIQCDQTVLQGPAGFGHFLVNNGNRIIKDATNGTTTIQTVFGNAGSVEITSGRILLTGGSGTFDFSGNTNLSPGATLEFGGGAFTLAFPTWNGSGGAVVLSGSGTRLSLVNGSTLGGFGHRLELGGGTITGLAFNMVGTQIDWSGTTLTTTAAAPAVASTPVSATLNLLGSTDHVLDRRSLFVNGHATWTGTGDVVLNGGDFGNPAVLAFTGSGATFYIRNDRSIRYGSAPYANVTIQAGSRLLKEMTTGTTVIDPCFNNAGIVEVASGTLTLTATCSTSSGLLLVRNGGTLRIDGNVSGTGNVTVDQGGTLTLAGGLATSGQNSISGTLDLRGGSLGNGSNSTTINAGGRVRGGGALYGTIVNNGIVSTTESIAFSGPVTNNGIMRFRGGGRAQFYGPTFVNNGILDLITGTIDLYNGTVLVNNGIVLDSSVVKVKRSSKTGDTVSIVIDGYAEHVFTLLYSPDLQVPFSVVGAPQTGTGGELTFIDTNNGAKGFYRVMVE